MFISESRNIQKAQSKERNKAKENGTARQNLRNKDVYICDRISILKCHKEIVNISQESKLENVRMK